jgi:hypothetical protein
VATSRLELPRALLRDRLFGDSIKAARAADPGCEEPARRLECQWQREQLPDVIRELVLDDQRLRNDICWSVFDC